MERKKPTGGYTMAKLPYNAPEVLAEIEFNNYYVRGLCMAAIVNGVGQLVIYRAKAVENPRAESERRMGMGVDPKAVLADLRAHVGMQTVLGLPPGPGSGVTLCMP